MYSGEIASVEAVALSIGIMWVSSGMCIFGGATAGVGGRICTLSCAAVGTGIGGGREAVSGEGEVAVVNMVMSFWMVAYRALLGS